MRKAMSLAVFDVQYDVTQSGRLRNMAILRCVKFKQQT